LLLATVWGGITYPWGSSQIIGLIVAGLILALLFVWQERRASEPILPPRLFKNDIFNVSILLSLLSGIAMFAAILYIPLYQQTVRGYSPTKSGLLMLPLMLGLLTASITVGRLTSKLGKYRIFPIIGTIVLTIGLWLFSHLTLTTSEVTIGLWMLVLGAGLGSFMQIMTLAIQNSVERRDMGTATSSATFFRSLGSSFGGAIFGSVLIARLTHYLAASLPVGSHISPKDVQRGGNLQHLPPTTLHAIQTSFVHAFHDMFLLAIPFALLAFGVSLFLRETPLRTSHEEPVLD
jgi:predicted MFS family arabinose efflux permease